MENLITASDSEFCDCRKLVNFRIIETPKDDVESPNIICEICHKLKREPIRFTFIINPNVQLTGKA
ncbi:MAG: hypothetical protein M3367_02695 [Acidobacteriota bacterium]|nr:hypothetical protein [Acidobacteriota bacterium]